MSLPLHPSDDQLIDLIQQLLPTGEEETVLAHLESCAECEERFRVLLRDHETARTTAPGARADVPPRGSVPRRWAVIVAVAAACFAGWYFVSHRPSHGEYWIPIEFDATALRSADSVATGSSKAFEAYGRHDASETIALLREAPESSDEMISSLRQLMLASALVNMGEPVEALSVLEKLEIFSLPVHWRRQAQWVEYLALRDSGQTDVAFQRLEKLVEDPGDVGVLAREEMKRREKS